MITVLSLVGSIVAPEAPDVVFLRSFVDMICAWLKKNSNERLIIVVGGGGPARLYQQAYRELIAAEYQQVDEADWIGIMATRLNAQLVKACFGDFCTDPVVYNPTGDISFTGRVLLAAGWKPGFSTDNDAVLLAERFAVKKVVSLSNIAQIYTDDPKKNPTAKPLCKISWKDFLAMVGTCWEPGKNTPFDPVASMRAQELGIQVICAAGRNLEGVQAILENRSFIGTIIY